VPGAQGAKDIPFLAARTNDLANIVSTDVRDRIEKKLADLEQRTGAQVAVLTVDSLDGDSIEDYAVRVFQTWKLGRKDVNDGVLFVVAAETTSTRDAQRAEAQLMLTDRPFAGCVLNRVPLGKHPYYYAPYHNAKYEAYYVSS